MKHLKSLLAGVALVFISGAVLAAGNLKVRVFPDEKSRTIVQISNVPQSKYEIIIENKKGETVYYKMTDSPSESYACCYNLSVLDDGEYWLTVTAGQEKIENILKIQKDNVELIRQRKEMRPYFTYRDNRLELSYLNFELENLKLMIYEKNTLLFEKKFEPEFAVHYGLDLSKLQSGKYDAVLSAKNNAFEYQITKK